MYSPIVKTFSVLTKFLLKSKTLSFFSYCPLQKSFDSTCVLLSRSISKTYSGFKIINCRLLSSLPKDHGKIIELDVEFDEVRLDDRDIELEKRNRKKNKSRRLKDEVTKKSEMEIKENLQIKTQLQEKEKEAFPKASNDFLRNSNLLSALLTDLKNRKNREKKQEIILEGKRLIHDAVSAGFKPLHIFISKRTDLVNLNLPEDVKIYLVSYKNLQLWSNVITSQGIIGIFKMPNLKTLENASDSLPLTVICDNIRDPGNLGSVLRVVAGAGCEKLFLTKGCVDIWEPKVLRAGAGAHFRLPVINDYLWCDIENEVSMDSKVVLADSDYNFTQNQDKINFKTQSEISSSLPLQCYHSIDYSSSKNTVLVIGGETHGLSYDAYKFALKRKGTKAFIPLSNGIESLNNSVALGIFIYEFKRQLDCVISKESCSMS